MTRPGAISVGCSGHQRVGRRVLTPLTDRIKAELAQLPPGQLIGVCSLAIGVDQLFARAVLDSGGVLHAVIPCRSYESTFEAHDVDTFNGLLLCASTVETLGFGAPSPAAFRAAGRRVVDQCDVLLAGYDGRRDDGAGGTASAFHYAVTVGRRVINVWPSATERP